MQKHEIENWALQVIEQVEQKRSVEDSLVELKATFIDAKKAARIIAGHANAAKGIPILWLIGVDEVQGVVGVNFSAYADWIAQVNKEFDGIYPYITDLNIYARGKYILALLIETDRAPFVIKNPDGGRITFEVPWLSNTSTRTAKRDDLLRILSPLQKFPTVEIHEGIVTRHILLKKVSMQGSTVLGEEIYEGERVAEWSLSLKLYFISNSQARVFIPFHYCKIDFVILAHPISGQFNNLSASFEQSGSGSLSSHVRGTATEIVIDGAGMILLNANAQLPGIPRDLQHTKLQVTFAFKLHGSNYSFPVVANFMEESAIQKKQRLPTPAIKKNVYAENIIQFPDFDEGQTESRKELTYKEKDIAEIYKWHFIREY